MLVWDSASAWQRFVGSCRRCGCPCAAKGAVVSFYASLTTSTGLLVSPAGSRDASCTVDVHTAEHLGL